MNQNIYTYGSYDLNKNTLLRTMQHDENLNNYARSKKFNQTQIDEFRKIAKHLYDGIQNGTLIADGFGNFEDKSNNANDYDETLYRHGLTYLHKNAIAVGNHNISDTPVVNTPEQKVNPTESIPENPEPVLNDNMFDASKHLFRTYFARQLSPFSQHEIELDNIIREYVAKFSGNKIEAYKDIGKKIGEYLEYNKNFDEIDFGDVDKALYLEGLNTLKTQLESGDISSINRELAAQLGVSQVIQCVDDYFADEEAEKQLKELQKELDNDSFKVELAGLVSDVISIVDPEPISAAGFAFAGDFARMKAQTMRGEDIFTWDNGLNLVLSIAGAIPAIGDAGIIGKATKVVKKIGGTLLTFVVATQALNIIENPEETMQAIKNVMSGSTDIADWNCVYTVLSIILGGAYSFRHRRDHKKAKELLTSPDAVKGLTFEANVKGTKKKVFVDKTEDINFIKQNAKNPEEVTKYLAKQHKDLEGIKILDVKTKKGPIQGVTWTGFKRGEPTHTINYKERIYIPEQQSLGVRFNLKKFDDYISNPNQYYIPGRKPVEPANAPKTSKTTSKTSKTTDSQELPNTQKTNDEPVVVNTEPGANLKSKEVDKKVEQPKSKNDEVVVKTSKSEVKQESKQSDSKPNITPNVTSKVSKLNIDDVLASSTKLTSEQKKKSKQNLEKLRNYIKNTPKRDKKAEQVFKNKKRPSASYLQVADDLKNAGLSEAEIKALLKQINAFNTGGILKAQNGTVVPNEETLQLEPSKKIVVFDPKILETINVPVDLKDFVTYDIDKNLYYLNPDKTIDDLQSKLCDEFFANTRIYRQTYSADKNGLPSNYSLSTDNNYYETIYEPGAASVDWVNQSADQRSSSLTEHDNIDRSNELDLNSHLKPMYVDNPELRIEDFLNWFDYQNKNTHFPEVTTNLANLLAYYNFLIEEAYNYKHSEAGIKYAESDETEYFNTQHRIRHRSQNQEGSTYGYDENSQRWNGSTTMSRTIDRAEKDKVIPFNLLEYSQTATDPELRKLADSVLKSGGYKYDLVLDQYGYLHANPIYETNIISLTPFYSYNDTLETETPANGETPSATESLNNTVVTEGTPAVNGETPVDASATGAVGTPDGTPGANTGQSDNSRKGSILTDNLEINTERMPKRPYTYKLAPIISMIEYLNAIDTNKKILDLSYKNKPLYYDPKEDFRKVQGDLYSLNLSRRNAGEFLHYLHSTIPTSDGQLYTNQMFKGYNQVFSEILPNGDQIDNKALRESIEKVFEQNVENHENRYNVAMKDRENANDVKKANIINEGKEKASNAKSTANISKDLKSFFNEQDKKLEAGRSYYYNNALPIHINNNPGYYIKNWDTSHQAIWSKAMRGETLTEGEQKVYDQLSVLVTRAFAKIMANNLGVDIGDVNADGINIGYTPKVVAGKKGGLLNHRKLANEMSNYLKECNKFALKLN